MDMKTRFKTRLIFIFTSLTFIAGITIFLMISFLVKSSIMDQINKSLDSYQLISKGTIEDIRPGFWSAKGNKLYKGTNLINDDYSFINIIKDRTGTFCSVYLDDKIVSSYLSNGAQTIDNEKADDEVIDTVLKQGKQYRGIAYINDAKYITRYMPISNNSGKIIGMWCIGTDYSTVKSELNRISLLLGIIILIVVLAAAVVVNFFVNNLVKNGECR